jgi:signal transduction histidine kinase
VSRELDPTTESEGPSHELRNRLATIANAVYYLKLVLPDAGEAGQYLQILEREVREVRRMLADSRGR